MKSAAKIGLALAGLVAVSTLVLAQRTPQEPARIVFPSTDQPPIQPTTTSLPKGSAGKVTKASVPSADVSSQLWRHIESPDYATYIANLRSIGCPEETIRDIVVMDVAKHFAAKQRVWRADLGNLLSCNSGMKRFALEQRRVLRELLDIEWNGFDAYLGLDETMPWLPVQKGQQVQQLQNVLAAKRDTLLKKHGVAAEEELPLEARQ